MIDEKVRRRIAEAAAEENGWKADEVRVEEVERLRRPTCSFYTAASTVLPLSQFRNFAMLAGKELVGAGDGRVVAKILDACSSDASADWWAEIVTRFHRALGAGLVLRDEKTRLDMTRKLNQAGKAFTPPTLDPSKRSLNYLLLNRDNYVLYRVEATRKADGTVEVSKTKVL